MGEHQLQREESLRIAAPAVYKKMVEIFEQYHIHPYDMQGIVLRKNDGLEITLRLSHNYAELSSTHISFDQVKKPDSKITQFFEQAAERCKDQLITDYYKMIKL
ncbi:hypothetical protein J2Z40_000235 [Cytobacillus eiseniae]|uniref:Uncharacterized protein n=1 Tax=Cytobacillus eiseniae TaxID=762947 RepID=A0ABS4R9W5_9BACI|nr:hypothetical protein [Cytobacillus eiseniae]MBP2239682.1 hypothetical protein [Cytobacillus eiseniae]